MTIGNRRPVSSEAALHRLELQCSRSEICESEARDKLKKWGIMQHDADYVVETLKKNRYIDDDRFCRSFIHDKLYYNRWGKKKIMLYLRQKHIDADIIDSQLDDIDPEDYVAILTKFLETKSKAIGDLGIYDNRAKLFRAALSRGFESYIITRVIRHIIQSMS